MIVWFLEHIFFLFASFRDETRAPYKRLIWTALSNNSCMIVVMQVFGSMSSIISSLFVTFSIWVVFSLKNGVDKFAHKTTFWKSCWKTFAMSHCSHQIYTICFLWMLSQASYNHELRKSFETLSLESSLMFSSSLEFNCWDIWFMLHLSCWFRKACLKSCWRITSAGCRTLVQLAGKILFLLRDESISTMWETL